MHADESPFSPSDLERIKAETFIRHVDFHREIGSTNDRASELMQQSIQPLPYLVLAESQTAGRGRGENRWWAGSGSLTFSVVLDAQEMQLPTARWPQASLTVGLAVGEALEELAGAAKLDVALKWPNDVYVGERKICGILVEGVNDASGRLLIGIGINVNNSVAEAPEELKNSATSLCDLLKQQVPLPDVLVQVLKQLAVRLPKTGFWSKQLRDDWRKRCLLTGRVIQIDQLGQILTGVCRGIDDEGALLLETEQGPQQCWSGVVTF